MSREMAMEPAVSLNHRSLVDPHNPWRELAPRRKFPLEIPLRIRLNILKMSMLRADFRPADRLSIEVPRKFVNRSSTLPELPGTRIFMIPFHVPAFRK